LNSRSLSGSFSSFEDEVDESENEETLSAFIVGNFWTCKFSLDESANVLWTQSVDENASIIEVFKSKENIATKTVWIANR